MLLYRTLRRNNYSLALNWVTMHKRMGVYFYIFSLKKDFVTEIDPCVTEACHIHVKFKSSLLEIQCTLGSFDRSITNYTDCMTSLVCVFFPEQHWLIRFRAHITDSSGHSPTLVPPPFVFDITSLKIHKAGQFT